MHSCLLLHAPFLPVPSLLPAPPPLCVHREAFNIPEGEHKTILAERQKHILDLVENFKAEITVKGNEMSLKEVLAFFLLMV